MAQSWRQLGEVSLGTNQKAEPRLRLKDAYFQALTAEDLSKLDISSLDCCTARTWWLLRPVSGVWVMALRHGQYWQLYDWLIQMYIGGFLTCTALWVNCNSLWGVSHWRIFLPFFIGHWQSPCTNLVASTACHQCCAKRLWKSLWGACLHPPTPEKPLWRLCEDFVRSFR